VHKSIIINRLDSTLSESRFPDLLETLVAASDGWRGWKQVRCFASRGSPVAAVISPTHLRVKQSLVNLEVAVRLHFGSIWVQSEILRFFRSLRVYRAAVLLKARAEHLPSELIMLKQTVSQLNPERSLSNLHCVRYLQRFPERL
jgi:hypothetical protein